VNEKQLPAGTSEAEFEQYSQQAMRELVRIQHEQERMEAVLSEVTGAGHEFELVHMIHGWAVRLVTSNVPCERLWLIPEPYTTEQVVATALKAVLDWAEEQTRQSFAFRGRRVATLTLGVKS
jgi:hypothetical protein